MNEQEPKPVGFQKGHPRWGGKKKRTAQAARTLAEAKACDPLAFLMDIINSQVYELVEFTEDGKEKRKKVSIDLATRIDAAKAVAPFLFPRLNAQHVVSEPAVTVEATVDINELMKDPEMVKLGQRLSLANTAATRSVVPVLPVHFANNNIE